MEVLVRSKTETIRRVMESPITAGEVTNPKDGSTVLASLAPIPDTTNESLVAPSDKGTIVLHVANLTRGRRYLLTTDTSRTLEIVTTSVDGTAVTINRPLPFDVGGGTVTGLEHGFSLVIPSAYTPHSVMVSWTMASGDTDAEEFLVVTRALRSPVRSSDLYPRWSILFDNEPADQKQDGVEYAPQILAAMTQLRAQLWRSGQVLDLVRSPFLVKETVLLFCGVILLGMGYDLQGSQDMASQLSEMRAAASSELQSLLLSDNLWIDSTENDVQDEGEKYGHGSQLRW